MYPKYGHSLFPKSNIEYRVAMTNLGGVVIAKISEEYTVWYVSTKLGKFCNRKKLNSAIHRALAKF